MITKIQPQFITQTNNCTNSQLKGKSQHSFDQNNEISSYNPELLKNYFVSFTGAKKDDSYDDGQQYDNVSIGIVKRASEIAKSYNHKEINHWHIISLAINESLGYIDQIDKNETDFDSIAVGEIPSFFESIFSKELFENPEYRKEFKNILKEEKKTVDKILDEMLIPKSKTKKPDVSDAYYNDMENVREELERSDSIVNGYDIFNGAFSSSLSSVNSYTNKFRLKVNDLLTLENKKSDKRLHFTNYDKRAENIIKNLNQDVNMFVTYDDTKVNPNHFVPSIIKAFKENKGSKLNPENTKIIEFNKNVDMMHFQNKISELAKNKDENYIVLFSQNVLSKTSTNDLGIFIMPPRYLKFMEQTPDNIHFIVFDTKDHYLNYSQTPAIEKAFSDFGETSIPVLNSEDVIKALYENKEYVNGLRSGLSKKTLEKIVNTSSQMSGNYPDKTINLLKKISSHYVDKKDITPKDVDKFVQDADYLFKQTNNDSSVEIVFDTGKRLNDIIGKTNTKKEAENIVKQIKNKTIGTKGFLVYSQDGMVGGGRRHTAEAIAGEAKVPFVSINTMDFGTKDVDLFGGSSMTPEASIKKVFSLVTTQAEANPNKSAILFIENFEYFSAGELVSEYHQKAMAQLIREMTNAQKKGLNIVVMGSLSNPKYMGEAAMKSFKFNDNIEISTPAIDEDERYEVLKYAIKHNDMKLAGNPDEQEQLLKSISKTLRGFSFIELKGFVKKAETIAQERNHKMMTKADLVESYLRITTGRPSIRQGFLHEKELVAKHECGHAVTLQVMNDLMKKQNKPWLIPDTVNFITLDPRGMYGGAMYRAKDNNDEMSFEKNFASVVCNYGGHSSEKKFYDMDGSFGISSDLNHATSTAELMATMMGQGFYTGKISLVNVDEEEDFERNITPKLREKIEADVSVITSNALTVSDLIVNTYADFINEFSDRYAHLVGTGDCLIDGDIFREELKEWKSKQPPEKQAEFDTLDKMILDAIKASKNGKIY